MKYIISILFTFTLLYGKCIELTPIMLGDELFIIIPVTAKCTNQENSESNNTDSTSNSDTEKNNTSIKQYIKLDTNLFINESNNTVIYIDHDINKSEKLIYNTAKIQEITKKIYSKIEDVYDFIFLVTNNKERPSSVSYSGVFLKTKNDVKGIGASLYDHTENYGSGGKLKGVMHFAYRKAITQGPTLHEIAHYWANKFDLDYTQAPYYKIGIGAHWGRTGFFSGKGQLGGYDAATFKDENLIYKGRKNNYRIYSADYFGWNANGGNSIPYNDVELYLMGMLPLEQVEDLLLPIPYASAISAEDVYAIDPDKKNDKNRKYFIVPFEKTDGTPYNSAGITRKSFSEILNENNILPREPSYHDAQKQFHVLTVLLDTTMPETYQVDVVNARISALAYRGDDNNSRNYNFWEATRGVGSLIVDTLDKHIRGSYEEYSVEEAFTSKTVSYRGKRYQTVKSPYTGRIWLDRNLGANKVCESSQESACYGYLFAFGRGFDGHQERNSSLTTIQKETLMGNDNRFYIADNGLYDWVKGGVDDDKSKRIAFMHASDGNGICPKGFRVPTIEEMNDETKYNEKGDVFPTDDHFLKLPLAGYRNTQSHSGTITYEGTKGAYWTSSSYQDENNRVSIKHIYFDNSNYITYSTYPAHGHSIRCIQESGK